MTEWQFYPVTQPVPEHLARLIEAFDAAEAQIGSKSLNLPSNAVLQALAPALSALDYEVETGKTRSEKVRVPILFGRQGKALSRLRSTLIRKASEPSSKLKPAELSSTISS